MGSYSYNLYGVCDIDLGSYYGLGLGVGADIEFNEGNSVPLAHSDSQVAAPGETFAVTDTLELLSSPDLDLSVSPISLGSGWSGEDWTGCVLGKDVLYTNAPKQHGKSFNMCFCDAHIASVRLTDLFNPTNTAQNWNVDHQLHSDLW
jgi:prepilin-type processing-associated H-X9-DG protein